MGSDEVPGELPAGDFSTWLSDMHAALAGERDADVPCDGCTACCTASQFVPIEPDERDTLARVPAELLFPAPLRPAGHKVLGYDERGHCPMLVDGRCSIYEHRPRACRMYDCRVFPAAGVVVREPAKVEIGRRAARWRFSYSSPDGRAAHDAVLAAGRAGTEGSESETERAVAAVRAVSPPGEARRRTT